MNYDDDEIGALRSRRGMRAHPPETDPRFLRPSPVVGRDQRATNRGKLAILRGTNIADKAKLLRLEAEDSQSWLLAVSSRFEGLAPTSSGARTGVWARGLAGSGGATIPVLFDVKPDTNIQMPGNSVDLDVEWAPSFRGTAAGIAPVSIAVLQGNLPATATVSAIASKGGTSRGRATCTQDFFTPFAGLYGIELPPFADEFMMFTTAVNYANLTSVDFLTSADVATASTIVSYTGAQLEAMKNAGQSAQVPGSAVAYLINTAGPFSGWGVSFLSL